jgi:Flp pilus assembly pilin Flp
MMSHAKRFVADESAVAAIEYALILAGIGVVFVSGLELVFAISSGVFTRAISTLGPIKH